MLIYTHIQSLLLYSLSYALIIFKVIYYFDIKNFIYYTYSIIPCINLKYQYEEIGR